MEILKSQTGATLELRLRGRLDASWADSLGQALDDAVRAGHHQVELNFAQVDYLSSAGLRMLLKHYKQLKAVHGRLTITEPNAATLAILKMAGFAQMLGASSPAAAAPAPGRPEPVRVEKNGAVFQVHDQKPGATLECALVGRPEKFFDSGFQAADCAAVNLPPGTFGLGLGAFGSGFDDCRERFGEFLAVAGAAMTLPTDGSNVPDFVVAEQALVPELKVLYGLVGKGQFRHMLRFDARAETPGVIALSDLVDAALGISGAPAAGFAVLAETAGLVGAALRRSPGRADAGSPLAFPGVRDWLSFTTERTHERNLVLVAGVAARDPAPAVAPFLRALAAGAPVRGHFHAAVFPYRPVQRGELDLDKTLGSLLATDTAQTLLHLLADDRPFEGVGQSEFMRGACWTGPIAAFSSTAA